MRQLMRYSLMLFTFIFGGTEYVQADGTFTVRSLIGTYAVGVRNILPNNRNNESVGVIGVIHFDGRGNVNNTDTIIYVPQNGAVGAFPIPSAQGTHPVKSNGIGVIKGFGGLPPDIEPPTIFVITRAQGEIA